jgi:hypothetical protein
VDLLGGPAAHGGAPVQENLQQADDTDILDADAGVADCAPGDGEGESLQKWEVHVHIQRLGLKAGKATSDDLKLLAHIVKVIQPFPQSEVPQIIR